MPFTDGFSCKCKRCGEFHNDVDGNGYCKKCQVYKRLFTEKIRKKLEGVMLPR